MIDHRPSDSRSYEAEALIKEAHARKRRRRFIIAGIIMILLAGAVIGYIVSSSNGRPLTPTTKTEQREPAKPVVNVAAATNHGQFAFISRGALWVLDGSTSSLREIPTKGLVPASPSFSPDGKWLAFVASKEKAECCGTYEVVSSELWMARANGTDAHPVAAVAFNTAIGWDPRADLFAVSVGEATSVPFGLPTGLDLVSPNVSIRALVAGTHSWGAVWAPDGSALAVSTAVPSTGSYVGVLDTYPVSGAPPTQWLNADTEQAYIIVPAGWWQVWGIVYTTVGNGAVPGGSGSADGSPLFALAGPGTTPSFLGETLETQGAGAPSATSAGWLSFAAKEPNHEEGRVVTQGKQVVACSPITKMCSAVPHPPDTVTEDPIWSPNGLMLDYVEAPQRDAPGCTQSALSDWYNSHQLYAYSPRDSSVRAITHTSGATVPQWSNNGKSLLYVSNDGLWLDTNPTQQPIEIAKPLFAPHEWPSYYGQVPFSAQFAWWTRSTDPVPA